MNSMWWDSLFDQHEFNRRRSEQTQREQIAVLNEKLKKLETEKNNNDQMAQERQKQEANKAKEESQKQEERVEKERKEREAERQADRGAHEEQERNHRQQMQMLNKDLREQQRESQRQNAENQERFVRLVLQSNSDNNKSQAEIQSLKSDISRQNEVYVKQSVQHQRECGQLKQQINELNQTVYDQKSHYSRLINELKLSEEKSKEHEQRYVMMMEAYEKNKSKLDEIERKRQEAELARMKRIEDIKLKAKSLQIDMVGKYNIGIAGMAGTGKSSLINALIGRDDAKTGSTETTIKITPYSSPEYPNIVYWDIPGGGTEKFNIKDYFENMCLFCFDFILIVVGNRITQFDIQFVRKALGYKVNVAFIRSKSDQDIESLSEQRFRKKYYKLSAEQKQEICKEQRLCIEDYFTKSMNECALASLKHYYVSSYAMSREEPDEYPIFDEHLMRHTVMEVCATNKVKKANIEDVNLDIEH